MTMDTSFSHQSRIVMCQNCGGAIQAAPAGGTFPCGHCGTPNALAPRDDRPVAIATGAPPLSEADRITRLRAQDGKPLLPPPSLQALMPGGQLEAWKVQEALAVWQATRAQLRGVNDFDAAERLLFLTMALSNQFADDMIRLRAMYESALDVLTLPRHRQTIRGYLARNAARRGDVQAAEAWLAPCDTRSDDLGTDSAYRFSRAFIDTVSGNWNGVIAVLGAGPDDVPIMDAMDPVCAVLRANAWERLGQIQTATDLLINYMSRGGASGRQTVTKIVELYKDLGLCQGSYLQANASHSAVAGKAAAARASGGIHTVFVPLGAVFLVIGLVGTVALIADTAGLELPVSLPSGVSGIGVTFLIMGLVFFLIGRGMAKAAARAAWLRANGISAKGQVVNIAPTGMRINGVPQVRFDLMVQVEGRAPFQASTKMLVNPAMLGQFGPGSSIPVRVDPRDPSNILIETD
jgi:hypothetical protein